MAELNNGQSCLEKKGMEARHKEIVRNGYSINDEYSATHPDAISDGDVNGKGTGGSHGAWLPDCSKPTNFIDYSNFTTDKGGGKYDIEGRNGIGGRKKAMVSSLYNSEHQYGANLVNTAENIADGQAVISW